MNTIKKINDLNQNNKKSKIRTDASEIKAFNEEITKLFKGSGLLIRPGCLLKVSSRHYKNYGFEATEENKNELLKELNKFFNKDRQDEQNEKTINPRGLIVQPYTHYTNILVNKISEISFEAIKKRKRNELIKISIIGSRNASVPLAIINTLKERELTLIENTQFYLIEPYQKKLEETINKMPIYGLKNISETKRGGYSAEYKTDDEFMVTQKDKEFDLIISYFHMHCKPFSDHLMEIRRVLKDDGVFIIADYFSPLWEYPVFVVNLLKNICPNNEIVNKFAQNFDIDPNKIRSFSDTEKTALQNHTEYWLNIFKQLHELELKNIKPIYFLRAHTTIQERIEILKEYKFTVDKQKIERILKLPKNFKNPFRVDPSSDFVGLITTVKE
ncbi:MAG: methyltransferase domain-containing protein [Candidatus Bilamarchaeaceae archaeon]